MQPVNRIIEEKQYTLYRTLPFSFPSAGYHDENWEWSDLNSVKNNYPVVVRSGKDLDILKLKLSTQDNFKTVLKQTRTKRQDFYKNYVSSRLECPICNHTENKEVFNLDGGVYVQCDICSHVYSHNPPTSSQLEEFYTNDADYTSIYTDKKTLMQRIEEVSIPKAKYAIEMYKNIYGKIPKRILDVGSGGGHFVQACKMLGITCEGIEVNKSAVDFCSKTFGFELRQSDFVKEQASNLNSPDLITFWGVIEHVYSPSAYLSKAQKVLSLNTGGLVMSSVPNWNSFSTAIQTAINPNIIRHMDPTIHVHMFTLNSVVTAYILNNIVPQGCWFYGMDAYEIVTQLVPNTELTNIDSSKLVRAISELQRAVDISGFSDEIALVGRV